MILLLVSAIATLAAAPVVRHVLLRSDLLDQPNERSSHVTPTPRGAGWACLVALAVAVAVALAIGRPVPWSVVGAAVVLGLVGAADDRRGLPAVARLAAQVATGAVCGALTGGAVSLVVGAVAFPVAVNVVNFMDGINGISGLTMLLWGLTTWLVARDHHDAALGVVGVVTAGLALGYLPWNVPQARIFLGDSGSYLFGALVAGGVLVAWHDHASVPLVVAPLMVYLVDTTATLCRRALAGQPLLQAHRSHVYQRLVRDAGLGHVFVAVLAAGLAAVGTVAWLWLSWPVAAAVTVALAAGYLALPSVLARAGGRVA